MIGYSDIETMSLEQIASLELSGEPLSPMDVSQIQQRKRELLSANSSQHPVQKSLMKEFPSYMLKPTSTISFERKTFLWIFSSFIFLLFAIPAMVSFGNGAEVRGVIFTILGMIILCIFVYPRSKWGIRKILLPKADYVQQTSGLTIFAKQRKFGVLKMWGRFKIYVPAVYDTMKWEESGRLLTVTKDGREFMIDIYNKEV